MKKIDELRDQSSGDLEQQLPQLCKEIFALRNTFKMTRKIEKSHLIKEKKRTRARIMTLLRERELNPAEATHGKS
jgi:large subunit ribosomal protein L29